MRESASELPPRVVLFDLDDTLIDHSGAVRHALQVVRRVEPGLQRRSARELAAWYQDHLERAHEGVVRGRISADDSRRDRFREIFRYAGVTPSPRAIDRAIATYRREYRAFRRVLPGVLGVLRGIRRHATVVILSNNRKEEQAEKVAEFGLGKYLDLIVTSEELPWGKPDRRAFLEAVGRAGGTPERATMVGDSWVTDVEGARAAGLAAVWVNRWGKGPAPDPSVPQLTGFRPISSAVSTILSARAPRRRGNPLLNP